MAHTYSYLLGLELPSLLLLVIVALLVIWVVRSWSQIPANHPPFPGRPFPVLGHLPYLGSNARDKLLEISKTTGDIFSMYFGGSLVVVLSGYDVMREALVKQADYFTARPIGGPSALLQITTGVIANSGSTWKENRSTVLHILRDFGMGKDVMSLKIMDEVKLYMDHLAALAGSPTDVKVITSCAIANVTCSVLFGQRFSYDDSEFIDLLHLLDEFMSLIGGGALHQWFPQVQYVPGDFFETKKLMRLDKEIMNKMNSYIKKVEDQTGDDLDHSNLISSYIDIMKEKQKKGQDTELSMKQLERVVFDMMIGGSETSTSTMLWFYLYMIHFPDVQEKVYQEICQEIGTSRSPTGQDKPRLRYTNAVILETQRLATISPFAVTHRCTEETTVRGYTIPKDVTVLLHLDAALLDDKIWGDALNFRPERFLKDGQLVCPEHFVAFGLGRRACLGESLAKMELFLFSVSVLQRFQILPADPSSLPPRTYVNGATCPPTPFAARFVERSADGSS